MRDGLWRWIAGCVCLAVAGIGPARAQETEATFSIDDACNALASSVVDAIAKDSKGKVVAIASFSASANLRTAAGVGLAARIAEALRAKGVLVKTPGDVQLSGEFFASRGDPSDRFSGADAPKPVTSGDETVAIRVEFKLRDRDNVEFHRGVVNVFGNAVLELAGATAALPASSKTGEYDEARERRAAAAMAAALRAPAATVNGDETRADARSPFAVIVSATRRGGNAYQRRRPTLRDGLSFVELAPTEEYVVQLRNSSSIEVLVSLMVDGLSPFTFAREPQFKAGESHFVVAPGTTFEVPGWFLTTSQSKAFEVTGYADSESMRLLGDNESIGQITATFKQSLPKPPPSQRSTVSGGDRLGTKQGRTLGKQYQAVERVPGDALATITVRYEKSR